MGFAHTAMSRIHALVRMGFDVIYPPRCPSCAVYVEANGNFCGACFGKLRMIDTPFCACCGVPFAFAVEPGTLCPACFDAPPDFDVARSALVYDSISAPLVTALKFHDQWAGLKRYAQMMQRLGGPLLHGADVIIPVPLHWRRLLRRKFNQSALLAYHMSELSGVPCAPDLLQRVHYTKPQMRLDRTTRLKNVKHAFAVAEGAAPLLVGKIVVLVDDVVTTGATVNACARVLKRAGAREVRVLALARTVKE